MPQLDQAKKALRVSDRRRAVNDRWRRRLRESMKAVRLAFTNNDKKAAAESIHTAESVLDRAARRHIITYNKASRTKSRLQKQLNKVQK